MEYYAGIDGGQSTTTAVLGNADGRVVGRGSSGGCDELGAGADSTRLRDALEAALREALRAAHLPKSTRLRALVAGVSGYDAEPVGAAPHFSADSVALMHDAPVAHAGAFGGGSGVVVIAGTGSVAYARDENGGVATLGGLGYVFGDEGSGFAIARNALAASLRHLHAGCRVALQACAFFNAASGAEILRSFYRGAISREHLASFARVVVEISTSDDDACARDAAVRAHRDLATLACDAAGRPEVHWSTPPRIAFLGGLMRNARFRERVHSSTTRANAALRVVPPRYEPAVGALILAYNSGGIRVEEVGGV